MHTAMSKAARGRPRGRPTTKTSRPQLSEASIRHYTQKLSSTFRDGWRKIPVELKMEVLRYCVVRPRTTWPDVPVSRKDPRLTREDIPLEGQPASPDAFYTTALQPLLYSKCGSDLANIARELFYRENVFLVNIHTPNDRGHCSAIRPYLPPPPVFAWLRKFEIDMIMATLDIHNLRVLQFGMLSKLKCHPIALRVRLHWVVGPYHTILRRAAGGRRPSQRLERSKAENVLCSTLDDLFSMQSDAQQAPIAINIPLRGSIEFVGKPCTRIDINKSTRRERPGTRPFAYPEWLQGYHGSEHLSKADTVRYEAKFRKLITFGTQETERE